MPSRLGSWFADFPEEALLIGCLLTGYGELEFDAFTCASEALQNEHLAFRLLFRLRSEGQRIDVVDSIMHPLMREFSMDGHYGHVIGAFRHCRTIRNTYAHCHWHHENNRLCYLNFEEAAQSPDYDSPAKIVPASLPLLRRQVSYFEYCSSGFLYLHSEMIRQRGGPPHDREAPKPQQKPSHDNIQN